MALFARPQSSAVRIVNPGTQDEPKTPSRKDSVQRQCRNVMIYGYCKFQDKGCAFSHPSSEPLHPGPSSPLPSESRTTITPQAVNAPVFVPKGSLFGNATPPPPSETRSPPEPTTPRSTARTTEYPTYDDQNGSYDAFDYQGDEDTTTQQMDDLDTHFYDDGQYRSFPSHYDADPFYLPAPVYLRQPLDYHLYTPAPPSAFIASTMYSHFVPPSQDLRQLLQKRSETVRETALIGSDLPEELQGYHTLVPLENTGSGIERRKLGNWYTTVYRAIRTSDGLPYALRRIENYRIMHQSAFAAIETWSRIQHPNIIPVIEAFTTKSFNDNSVVVVHSYHPNAQTLYDLHLQRKPPPPAPYQPLGRSVRMAQNQNLTTAIPERTMWSYIVQIASAIKRVHEVGQAMRMIDVSKILVTGQNRVRISTCGVIDVLMHDIHHDIGVLQQEDMTMFGRLIFALCCNNVAASSGQVFQKSLEIMGRNYSSEIKGVALFLISKGGPHRSIDQLLDMIRARVLTEMEDSLIGTDRLEYELLGELENARLVRLLCKFGFINERPEFAREPRWSETGDRYIIKLFRDYVFHQVDEHNNPVVNYSHVLTCLNKLDAGTDEKVLLIARDEQSCLVVSYKEIKACIELAFGDLTRGTTVRS